MADISSKVALNVTNDVKARPAFDLSADMSGSQFIDMMMVRLTALGSDDDDLKAAAKSAIENGNIRDGNVMRQLKGLKEKKAADVAETNKATPAAEVKAKVKARVKEIASRDELPVKDDSSLKLLKKVAEFIAKAESEGQIKLPPELSQKLQEFLAKGDDLKAFDIAAFMREFSDAFKTMIVAMNAAGKNDASLQWPQELSAELKEAGLGKFIQDGKELTVYDVARLVKALVNKSEDAAVATLNEKSQNTLVPQDRADILVNAAAANKEVKKPVKAEAEVIVDTNTVDPLLVEGEATVAQQQLARKGKRDLADPNAASGQDGKVKDVVTPHNALLNAMAASATRGNVKANVENFEAKIALNNASSVNGITNANAADSLSKATATAQNAKFTAALQTAQSAQSPATQQVTVQLAQRANKSGNISIQLSPAELGRVDVRLTIGRDGTTHAVIAADKPETLAMLQKDATALEKALQQAGLNANSENMSFNLREQRQSQQFDQGRKRFSRDDLDDSVVKEVAISNLAAEAIINNDQVNYHA